MTVIAEPAVTIDPARPPAASQRRAYAWYVLAILFLANCFNAMDRSIVTLLVEPIKHDLGLNDIQIGLIAGLGYALVYSLVSIAIARLVDRGNRKTTLSVGIAFWSVMTAATGQATGFATMLAARFGIAAGEASCYPNALSLIGDYFPAAKRPRAIAFSSSAPTPASSSASPPPACWPRITAGDRRSACSACPGSRLRQSCS